MLIIHAFLGNINLTSFNDNILNLESTMLLFNGLRLIINLFLSPFGTIKIEDKKQRSVIPTFCIAPFSFKSKTSSIILVGNFFGRRLSLRHFGNLSLNFQLTPCDIIFIAQGSCKSTQFCWNILRRPPNKSCFMRGAFFLKFSSSVEIREASSTTFASSKGLSPSIRLSFILPRANKRLLIRKASSLRDITSFIL